MRSAAILLLSSLVCSSAIAERYATNYGILFTAYLCPRSFVGITELKLDEVQLAQLVRLNSDFRTEFADLHKEFWKWTPDSDYFRDGYVAKTEFAEKINARILADIDGVLETDDQRNRFRELLTQRLIAEFQFDGVLRLHKIKVTKQQHRQLVKAAVQAVEDLPTFEEVRYESMLIGLASEIAQEDLAEAAGEPFTKPLRIGEWAFDGVCPLEIYDPAPLKLIMRLEIQVELKFSAKQTLLTFSESSKDLREFPNAVTQRINAILQQANEKQRKKDEESLTADMQLWSSKRDDFINDLLTEEQAQRFRELLFQYDVKNGRLSHAAQLAGIPLSDQQVEDARMKGQRVHHFREQTEKLKAGLGVLEELIGQRRPFQICGKISLLPRTHPDAESDWERNTRLEFEARTSGTQERRNPRRADRKR